MEFVALIPLLAIVGVALWQSVEVVERATLAAVGANAAARAIAVGSSPRRALELAMPGSAAKSAVIRRLGRGVSISLPVELVTTGAVLSTVSATAAFPEQAP